MNKKFFIKVALFYFLLFVFLPFSKSETLDIREQISIGNAKVVNENNIKLPTKWETSTWDTGGTNSAINPAKYFNDALSSTPTLIAIPPNHIGSETRIILNNKINGGDYFLRGRIGLRKNNLNINSFVRLNIYGYGSGYPKNAYSNGRVLLRRILISNKQIYNLNLYLGKLAKNKFLKFEIGVQLPETEKNNNNALTILENLRIESNQTIDLTSLAVKGSAKHSDGSEVYFGQNSKALKDGFFGKGGAILNNKTYVGKKHIYVVPSNNAQDIITLNLKPSYLDLSRKYSFHARITGDNRFCSKDGILISANYDGRRFNREESINYNLLSNKNISDNDIVNISARNFGFITQRNEFQINFTVNNNGTQKCDRLKIVDPILVDEGPAYEIGVNQSTIQGVGADYQTRIQAASLVGNKTIRIGMGGNSAAAINQFINLAKYADSMGLEILPVLTILDNEYQQDAPIPDVSNEVFKKICNKDQPKPYIRYADTTKIGNRIKKYIAALHANNLNLQEMEIGNENNTSCNNTIIPTLDVDTKVGEEGWRPTGQNDPILKSAVSEYAQFYATMYQIIRDEEPNAKIVLGGAAYMRKESLSGIPANMFLQELRSTNIKINDNDVNIDVIKYLSDVVAIHLYPKVDPKESSPLEEINEAKSRVEEIANIIGENKPIWVTEIGLSRIEFNNYPQMSYSYYIKMLQSIAQSEGANIERFYLFSLDTQNGISKFKLFNGGTEGAIWQLIDSSKDLPPIFVDSNGNPAVPPSEIRMFYQEHAATLEPFADAFMPLHYGSK